MDSVNELVKLLSSGNLRVATGLWLLPKIYVGCEEDEAHRLNLEPVDLRNNLLKSMPDGTKYSGLSPDLVFELVNQTSKAEGDWSGALVYNIDLLLARLSSDDRKIIWRDLFDALPHRRRGVLIAMPETAVNLLPTYEEIGRWGHEKRLAGSNIERFFQ